MKSKFSHVGARIEQLVAKIAVVVPNVDITKLTAMIDQYLSERSTTWVSQPQFLPDRFDALDARFASVVTARDTYTAVMAPGRADRPTFVECIRTARAVYGYELGTAGMLVQIFTHLQEQGVIGQMRMAALVAQG